MDKVETIIKDLCRELALDFPEYFRIAFNEEDDSKKLCDDANEFLKMDEIRVGRDFKLYGFMADVSSTEGAIADFADVLMWIKQKHPKVFESIRDRVESWSSFFDQEMQQGWIELWSNES